MADMTVDTIRMSNGSRLVWDQSIISIFHPDHHNFIHKSDIYNDILRLLGLHFYL